MTGPLRRIDGLDVRAGGTRTQARSLPEEVAVAVTVNGSTHAVMMATPQDLADFATGFALTEGLVTDPAQIETLEIVPMPAGIEARLWLDATRAQAAAERRRGMAGPVGCGLCGIESLEAAMRPLPRIDSALRLPFAEAARASDALAALQPLHHEAHALHAAGVLRPGAGIALAREDVGRHNALDKAIGAALRAGLGLRGCALVVTSRLSVELVQKAALAGAPVLIAVSAPTAAAVDAAARAGVTLAAFARRGTLALFTHPDRIVHEAADVA